MKINIPLHYLASLLTFLCFIACNHVYPNHTDGTKSSNNQRTHTSNQSQDKLKEPPIQYYIENLQAYITNFSKSSIENLSELIKLYQDNNDLLPHYEQLFCQQLYKEGLISTLDDTALTRQLYSVLSSPYAKSDLIGKPFNELNHATYNESCDKLRAKVNPNFSAKYVVPEHYWKQYFAHPYDTHPNISKPMKHLSKMMFDNLKNQIIIAIFALLNQAGSNHMDTSSLTAPSKLNAAHKKIAQKANHLIQKIIDLRCHNNPKCSIKIGLMRMWQDVIQKTKLRHLKYQETTICAHLVAYFNKLTLKHYYRITIKGKKLLDYLTTNIRLLLAKNDLDVTQLNNSVHKLIHTICIYSSVRILAHSGVIHKIITLLRTSEEASSTKSNIRSYFCMQAYPKKKDPTIDVSDVCIALINLGMGNIDFKSGYSNLMETLANRAKLSSEASKK